MLSWTWISQYFIIITIHFKTRYFAEDLIMTASDIGIYRKGYIPDYFLIGLFWIYFNEKCLSWKILSIDSLEVFPGLLRCCGGAVFNNTWQFQAVDCCLRELHLRCRGGSESSTVLLAVNDVKSLIRQIRTPIQTLIDEFLVVMV